MARYCMTEQGKKRYNDLQMSIDGIAGARNVESLKSKVLNELMHNDSVDIMGKFKEDKLHYKRGYPYDSVKKVISDLEYCHMIEVA